MLSIGEIQHPEAGIDLGSDGFPSRRAVEVTFPELRFAERLQIAVSAVVLQQLQDSCTNCKRLRQLFRPDEIEIVCGSMIFGESSPNAPHQTAHRKIESRRTILPLIVTIRRELQNLR